MTINFISHADVMDRTLLTRAEIQSMLRRGIFVKPVEVSPGNLMWRESDIDHWIETRPIAEDLPVPKEIRRRTSKGNCSSSC
jgi:predicted DNA-binding transcriptional regulator AlpA